MMIASWFSVKWIRQSAGSTDGLIGRGMPILKCLPDWRWICLTMLGLGFACVSRPVGAADVQATLYVSPTGSDDNLGTEAKPFSTITEARQAVRAVNKNMNGDIVVVLRGGIYRIDTTIAFESEDSGSNGHNIIYQAAKHEKPIISGGTAVVGWEQDEKGRWKAPAPLANFRQMYVGGKRASRASGPEPEGIELVGNEGYKTTNVAMAEWCNPQDIELCYRVVWCHTRCKVQSITRQRDHAVLTMQQPQFTHARTKEGVRAEIPTSIENALELLDEPGEWYLDRAAKTVYYMPREGEDMVKVEVIVPALERIVELCGTLEKPVRNIRFEGITFQHGSWLRPSEIGLCDVQANFLNDSDRKDSFVRAGGFANVHNEHLKSPANVVCHAAKSIRFDRCSFTQLGGAGVDIEFGSRDNVVSGCHFFDISGSAIQVGDVLKDDHHPDDPRKIVKNNSIVNNFIHDCAVEYMGGVGVFAGYTERTVIEHNEITALPYSGISLGWGWGEEDAGGGPPNYVQPFRYDTPTPAENNRIEQNHIHHVMQSLEDGAGVYTLGNMPGTIIRGNHIHDNGGGPGGIYLDEGSGFIEITGNLVYNVQTPMNYNNHAQNRKDTCKEHDNSFGEKPDQAKPITEKAGLEPEYQDLLK
jgi:hypothetical protein